MTRSTPAAIARTKGEALLDLGYAIELSALNQRFFERVHKAIAALSLLAGSAGFVTIFHPSSAVVMVAGFAVGSLAIIEQVYDFRGRATVHTMLLRRFLKLRSRAGPMDLLQIDAAMDRIAIDAIPVIQGLRNVAFNNNLSRNGLSHRAVTLTRWQRLLSKIV